ncbi:MAG: hypothetical protein ACXVXP_11180 [Mycobacteriaceae bacterium]
MRKHITLITTGLVLVLAAIAMAASGEVVPVTTVSVHQIPSAVSIRRANEPIATVIFVGKVTAANGVPQSGREVDLFSTYDRFLGTSITGTYAGHSQGYWQLRVIQPRDWMSTITKRHFDAYVTDRFLLWIDYLPAQSPVIPF